MTPLQNPQLEALAQCLAKAQNEAVLMPAPLQAQIPADANEAYSVQHRVLALRAQAIAGWKVGAKTSDGPIQGAPLPACGVLPTSSRLSLSRMATLGLELEVAFSLNRTFEARPEPYGDAEVWEGIGSVMATIEVVGSRLPDWSASAKLMQLADMQNHSALVVGHAVPYAADMVFEPVHLQFEFEGYIVASGPCLNPAGDPRRLLPWLVNHACARGLSVTPDQVLTAGSYTGLYATQARGQARGEIQGLPPVSLTLE